MSARIRKWFEERDMPAPWFAYGDEKEPSWNGLLEGKDPSETLRRLVEGDPLEIGMLAPLVASDEAQLVFLDRLTARTCAQVAYRAATGASTTPNLFSWLRTLAIQCLSDIGEQDTEEERARIPMDPQSLAEFTTLLPTEIGIEPELSRIGVILFNRFPKQDRVPFYRCAIEAFEVEEVAVESGESVDKVCRRIERVTEGLVMQVETIKERRGKK